MPAMKVTPDAAMRARDVSRPHAEQLRWAEEAEADATDVVIRADVAAEPGVAGPEAGYRLVARAASEVDLSDSESTDSEDRPADESQVDPVDGTRRRRVRGFRSSSRRGRPSR